MEFAGYIAMIGVGIVLGITGGGGAILAIPILVYFFAVDVVTASTYSFFIVGTTSMTGAILKRQEKLLDIPTALYFGIPSVATVFAVRKWLIGIIPSSVVQYGSFILTKQTLLLSVFALLTILSSILLIVPYKSKIEGLKQSHAGLITAGITTGLLAGLTGIGGGFLIIPALLIFTQLPLKTAVGTALLVVALNSAFGFLGSFNITHINWILLLTVTTLSISGIFIGNYSLQRIPSSFLKHAFGLITFCLGIWMLFSACMSCTPD